MANRLDPTSRAEAEQAARDHVLKLPIRHMNALRDKVGETRWREMSWQDKKRAATEMEANGLPVDSSMDTSWSTDLFQQMASPDYGLNQEKDAVLYKDAVSKLFDEAVAARHMPEAKFPDTHKPGEGQRVYGLDFDAFHGRICKYLFESLRKEQLEVVWDDRMTGALKSDAKRAADFAARRRQRPGVALDMPTNPDEAGLHDVEFMLEQLAVHMAMLQSELLDKMYAAISKYRRKRIKRMQKEAGGDGTGADGDAVAADGEADNDDAETTVQADGAREPDHKAHIDVFDEAELKGLTRPEQFRRLNERLDAMKERVGGIEKGNDALQRQVMERQYVVDGATALSPNQRAVKKALMRYYGPRIPFRLQDFRTLVDLSLPGTTHALAGQIWAAVMPAPRHPDTHVTQKCSFDELYMMVHEAATLHMSDTEVLQQAIKRAGQLCPPKARVSQGRGGSPGAGDAASPTGVPLVRPRRTLDDLIVQRKEEVRAVETRIRRAKVARDETRQQLQELNARIEAEKQRQIAEAEANREPEHPPPELPDTLYVVITGGWYERDSLGRARPGKCSPVYKAAGEYQLTRDDIDDPEWTRVEAPRAVMRSVNGVWCVTAYPAAGEEVDVVTSGAPHDGWRPHEVHPGGWGVVGDMSVWRVVVTAERPDPDDASKVQGLCGTCRPVEGPRRLGLWSAELANAQSQKEVDALDAARVDMLRNADNMCTGLRIMQDNVEAPFITAPMAGRLGHIRHASPQRPAGVVNYRTGGGYDSRGATFAMDPSQGPAPWGTEGGLNAAVLPQKWTGGREATRHEELHRLPAATHRPLPAPASTRVPFVSDASAVTSTLRGLRSTNPFAKRQTGASDVHREQERATTRPVPFVHPQLPANNVLPGHLTLPATQEALDHPYLRSLDGGPEVHL